MVTFERPPFIDNDEVWAEAVKYAELARLHMHIGGGTDDSTALAIAVAWAMGHQQGFAQALE